jgi:RNA polymerase sigma-70 factor (ECF subfamily)
MEDEELVERVAAGDLAAFSTLYDRHAQRLYAWSAHVLGPAQAEDATQEIFLRLWQHAGQFDPGRGTFASWFTAIARHHIVRQISRQGSQHRVSAAIEIAEILAVVRCPDPGPDEILGQREDAAALAEALQLLPEEQRLVLILAYFAGLSQSQIASQLSLPLGTVKKRTRLGMGKLRMALGSPGAETRHSLSDSAGAGGATD